MAQRLKMSSSFMNTGSYVNGKWYHPRRSQISKNINPADTSDVIAEYPLATAADVRLAIDAAVAAWPAWKKTPGPERGRVLWRAADIARRRVDEIAQTLTREEGKILKEAQRRSAEGHLAARVLRRRRLPHARQDAAVRIARHVHLHDPPAARRRRPDRAVEFSVGDSGVEERAGDRLRQLRRLQAGRAHAGDVGPARRDLRRGRIASGRLQHAGRLAAPRSARRWSMRRSCARSRSPDRTRSAASCTSRRRSAARRSRARWAARTPSS